MKRSVKLLFPSVFAKIKLYYAAQQLGRNKNYWAKGIFDDHYTTLVLDKILTKNSNCIDIGCAVGDILSEISKRAELGSHFAFEPQPSKYEYLKRRFRKKSKIQISNICISDNEGNEIFYELKADTGYSGLKKTELALNLFGEESYESYKVTTNLLDNIIPNDINIDLIKIDVEGAEFKILQGAVNLIRKHKPIVIFEFGIPAKSYHTKPEDIYNYFTKLDMEVSLMEYFLIGKEAFSLLEFTKYHEKDYGNYFIAYAK